MADYHSLLMRAVANLPNAGTPATRAAIYGRARKALLEQLRSLRPPLPESDITREERALDAAIAEIEERYGSQEPAPALASRRRRRPRLEPESRARRRRRPSPRPRRNSLRSSAPVRLRRPGRPLPRRARLRKRERQANPGPQPCPFRARRSDLRRRRKGGTRRPSSPPQAPTLSAGRPAAAAPTAASPARSQLAAAMANQPSSASRAGRAAPPVGARGAEDEGLPGVAALDPAKAIRPSKTDDGDDVRGPANCREPQRRSRAMGRGAGSRGRDSTAPAWRPDRRRRSSARSRRAPMSPSRNACSGSRRRSSLELFLRWREPRS